jgi:ABC-type uncharacterized transport system substrate-binding protein
MSNRREFITLLGGAVVWPLTARAQRRAVPMIGFLSAASSDGFSDRLRAFRQGLKDTGHVEGENIAIDYRWAENQLNRLPDLADELVLRDSAVLVTSGGSLPALAAKTATKTIPIIFVAAADPIKAAIVDSLSRPGGNATGIYFFAADLIAKQLDLLRELIPGATRVAVLVNPADAERATATAREAEVAARTLKFRIQFFKAATRQQINAVFASLVHERADALFVAADPFFTTRRVQLANLAARHSIPTLAVSRDYPEAGALMSYGTDINDAYRQAGVYVGRILKGAKPGDLPVTQSTKFEFVINVQTATLLGLEIPPMLLARADEVIE